jgi:HPr kinase/phosphorylase
MRTRISAGEVFDELHERLGLRWITGQRGKDRTLERAEQQTRRPSLAGYLNVIHPNKVQIIGTSELAWLDELDARQRWEKIEKILDFAPMALVITQNHPCPPDLRNACEESGTPLWVSPRRVLDLDVPEFHLPVAPGRNLAVLAEAAVRLFILRAKGADPAAAFLARHAILLQQGEPG